MPKRTYLQENYEYSQRRWSEWMYSVLSRRFVIKAGTLAALGGAAALPQLMAACAGGGAQQETSVGTELATGAFKYSRFPLVERYNWRLVPWEMTPYYGGEYRDSLIAQLATTWDMLRNSPTSKGGRFWQTLYRLHYGPGQATAGWPVPPMDYEDTDGPVRIEPNAAAAMPTHAPDFSWYEVKLKPDLYFHYNTGAETTPEVKAMIEKVGGRNVTADDVKYVYDTFKDPKQSLFADNLEYLDRVEVVDKYTLRFHMARPVMFFDQVMASSFYYIFPPEHHQGPKTAWDGWAIGTGPFMLQSYRYQGDAAAVRHPKYTEVDRGGFRLPYADKLTGSYIVDTVVGKSAIRTGQIDSWFTSGLEALQDILNTNPELVVGIIPQDPNVHTLYAINWKNPVWGKSEAGLKMRRALSMSIDRRGLNELILGGAGVPSYATPYDFMGMKAPAFWDELGPYYEYNPAEAKRLMAEAGYPNGYDIELVRVLGPSFFVASTEEAMQQQLAASGFRLTFNEKELTVVNNLRIKKEFKDIISGSQDSGYDMEMNIYRLWAGPNAARNYGSVEDDILADLAVKQRYELDYERRRDIARQVHQRFLDIIPQLNVLSPHHWNAWQPWFHNTSDNIHSWMCCWGSQQVRQVFLDDRAPSGRGGKRGKEGTWGVPYDRQGRKV
ncbi:MAG TPA: ABC transporter substrate-binding protein [Dehalococcoidia bacterium]|nr:ABC transporter substrate-binding protein [Dehalococcoidia bacterium]